VAGVAFDVSIAAVGNWGLRMRENRIFLANRQGDQIEQQATL